MARLEVFVLVLCLICLTESSPTASKPTVTYYLHVKHVSAKLLITTVLGQQKHCEFISNPIEVSQKIHARTEGSHLLRVSELDFTEAEKQCGNYGLPNYAIGAIWPGTKWCGDGNISDHVCDLGEDREVDQCCRTHDFCDEFIPMRETKHGITNNEDFTMSHCDCDKSFRRCLKNVNSVSANSLGEIFFDFLQSSCFEYTYPIIVTKLADCKEHELDRSKPKKWQVFPPMSYDCTM